MQRYRLIFRGPQTSKTIGAVHLPCGAPRYLNSNELPMTISSLKRENVDVELVDEGTPEEDAGVAALPVVAAGSVGIVWDGTIQKKYTDEHGFFLKGEPRFDLPLDAVEIFARRSGFRKVDA